MCDSANIAPPSYLASPSLSSKIHAKGMTMRLASTMLLATTLAVAACNNRANVQCLENPNCNLTTGGVCAVAPTGNHWCAYPDGSCLGGYRFSDQDVGDGVSGMCVAATDAGVDAPPDINGDKTCKLRIAFVDGNPSFNDFEDDNSGRRQVWVTNPDGSGAINLSSAAGNDSAHPSWSPTGTKVAFASNLTGKYDVFVVNVDGSGLTNLTAGSDVLYDASNPVWSPDGTRIAFTTRGHLWMMNANGTGASQISSLIMSNQIAWSPDSKKIVFGVTVPTSGSALYVATIGDTAAPLKINSGNTFEYRPTWAPSAQITFDNLSDVFSVNGDGTGLFNVTKDAASHNGSPVPFNNGTSILFSSNRDNGYREIWSTPAAGGAVTQVTHHMILNGTDAPKAVSPDGSLLTFSRIIQTVKPDFSVVTTYQLGVAKLDGSELHLFNAPGGSNGTEARFSACP